jgi:DNA-directed RNA polymerase beta' subunit
MMASRIGLMDTALKTADIGHMHHRMVKVLEDLTLRYDGSVRNASNVIFSCIRIPMDFPLLKLFRASSNSLGNVLSFIDLDTTIGYLNTLNGY